MKRVLIGLLLAAVMVTWVAAFSFDEMEAEGISLKAGPTDVTEDLAISWVESALYPKLAEKNQDIFVEVKLTSPVKAVNLKLDYEDKALPLFSEDGKNWNRLVKIAPQTPSGMHLAKVVIEGQKNASITRTLDFIIKEDASAQNNMPLTILSTVVVMENGQAVRQLLPGVKVNAVCKAPFYRVKLDDGSEGWVEASKVKEPTEDLYLNGVRLYQEKQYSESEANLKQVLSFDPRHARAQFYLAKIYIVQGKMDAAVAQLKEAKANDPENQKIAALADSLANRALSERKYDRVLALKPELMLSTRVVNVASAPAPKPAAKAVAVAKRTEAPAVSTAVIKDTVALVKGQRTNKGTLITSAINSVLSLTRSLGTKISEGGWRVVSASDGVRVVYACQQERSGKQEAEDFVWKVDPDRKTAVPINENARLLMNRW